MAAAIFPSSPTIGQQVTVYGKIYTWNGTVWESITSSLSALNIDDLTDVSVSGVVNGNYLKFDGSNWIPGDASSTLSDLSDVVVSGVVNNNVLKYNGTKWIPGTPISSLDDLSDVVVTGVTTSGKVLQYNGTNWTPGTVSVPSTLDDLSDVVVTGAVSNNNILKYNGSKWVQGTVASLGVSFNDLSDVDTSTSAPVNNSSIKFNGTNWVPGQPYVGITSASPPSFNSVVPGTVWINSETLKQYIYVVDASSNKVWVSFGNPNVTKSIELGSLNNVVVSGATVDDFLKYDGTSWVPGTVSSGASALTALSDVSITTPTNDQILRYSSTSSTWVNMFEGSRSLYRNKIVNGDMKIVQRSPPGSLNQISFSNVNTTAKYYLADRWYYQQNRTENVFNCSTNVYGLGYFRGFNGVVTGHCLVTANTTGFNYSDSIYGLFHDIEAKDTEEFNLGITGYAKPMVLSFWANVSAAGTYPVSVNIGTTHSFVSSYTITSDTASSNSNWQYFQIPIPPFTLTSVAITGTNYPIRICFGAMIGSSYTTSTSNQWVAGQFYNATGYANLQSFKTLLVGSVQLEVGTVATPFEFVDSSLQLKRCQRYFWSVDSSGASSGAPMYGGIMGSVGSTTTSALFRIEHPEIMRVAPTISQTGTIVMKDSSGWSSTATYWSANNRTNISELTFNLATAGTLNRPIFLLTASLSGKLEFRADD